VKQQGAVMEDEKIGYAKCKTCEQSFPVVRSPRGGRVPVYCSTRCTPSAYKPAVLAESLPCERCGTPFAPSNGQQRFCSVRCWPSTVAPSDLTPDQAATPEQRGGLLGAQAKRERKELGVPPNADAVGQREYSDEEREFLAAVDKYKQKRRFPTLCELLAVLKGLGYRKVANEEVR
jgi:hypothetical protein